jgi:prophage maintenance system killer protein
LKSDLVSIVLIAYLWAPAAFPKPEKAFEGECVKEFEKIFTPHLKSAPQSSSIKPSLSFERKLSLAEAPLRASQTEIQKLQEFLKNPLFLRKKSPSQEVLKKASELLPPKMAQAFSDWVQGQFAEDPRVSFEDHYLGRQRSEFPEGPKRYHSRGERPFDGYLAARSFLSDIPLEKIDLSQVQEAHRKLMSRESSRESSGKIFQVDGHLAKNSQGLKDSELGQIRNEGVGFEVEGKQLPQGFSATGKTLFSVKRENIFLNENKDSRITYAPLSRWRAIDNRKNLSSGLVMKLRGLEEKYGVKALDNKNVPEIQEATQAFVKELAKRIWEDAKNEVKEATSYKEVIKAAAEFQRDFISVHPFFDGNGRIARLLTEKLLESRGLPAPTYTYWGEDVALSRSEMEALLSQSVHHSEKYLSALSKGLETGESFEKVMNPALIARAKELLGDPTAEFDSKEFLNWVQDHREDHSSFPEAVRAFAKSHSIAGQSRSELTPERSEIVQKQMGDLYRQFRLDEFQLWLKEQPPFSSFEESVGDYRKWLSSLSYADGSGAIRLASPEFQMTFGKLSPTEAEFNKKLKDYYSEEPVYRGVPSNKFLSDLELVQLFVRPSNFNIGNGVSFKEAPESALPVFQQFNLGLLRDGAFLKKQIIDHKNGMSDDYHMTGMVSFSEKKHVAHHWHENFSDPYGIIFTAKKRDVGVVNTGKHNERFGKPGLEGEFEEAMVGGLDPESLASIELVEHKPEKESTVRKTKTATRLGYNRIQITEAELDFMDRVKTGKSTVWEIMPDGSVRQTSPNSFR